MQIDKNGLVIIPQEDIDTFLDYRLPLQDRLARLATFLRSDAWSASKFQSASDLICEAADRLSRLKAEDTERVRMFTAMYTTIQEQKEIIHNMRKEHARDIFVLEQELLSLKSDY